MKFKDLMVIKAIVCLAFGILLLAVPDKLLSIFGATLSAGGIFTAREYGSSLSVIYLFAGLQKMQEYLTQGEQLLLDYLFTTS